MPEKSNTKEFIEKAKLVHGDKYDYSKVEYVNSHKKVCIICHIHGEFQQMPYSHTYGKGCAKCDGKNKTTKYFVEKAKLIHSNKYNYSKVEYVNCDLKVCILCPEHGEFWQTPYKHINIKQGCPKCVGKNKTTDEILKQFKIVHGDKYDYSKVNYINNRTKVCIVCPIHGEFWQKPDHHLQGISCPICNESRLEKETALLLDESNIKYERQKRFSWLGRQSLDFYLPDYNIGIECQGEQHFKPRSFGSKKNNIAEDNLLNIKNLDNKKYNLCKENNVKLLYYCEKKYFTENYIDKLYFDMQELINNIKSLTTTNGLSNVIVKPQSLNHI